MITVHWQATGKYRVFAATTRAALVAVVAFWGLAAAGCSGFAEEVQQNRQGPASEAESDQGAEVAQGLYESMIEVFGEDTAGVERTVDESLTVISHYESVDDRRRRRFVGRVVPLRGGIGVRITAEYQVEESVDGGDWEDEPREAVRAEAEPDELRLARSVERHYHSQS